MPYQPISGWQALFAGLALMFFGPMLCIVLAVSAQSVLSVLFVFGAILSFIGGIIVLCGLMAIAPNEARVLLLFGNYVGTVKSSGFFFVNPFFSKRKVSLRVRNFETGAIHTPEHRDAAGTVVAQKSRGVSRPSKVNDRHGNPIEISAVVVWHVLDTAEALFEVDDFEDFIEVQSEAALRSLASRHPYDSEDHEVSLRGNTQEICDELRHDIQERVDKAGIKIIEARISHLAYSAEIAAAMLQRQQAQAVVAARTRIVEGAVGMVEMALDRLTADKIVELDATQRATLVANLLVVLCGDRHAQPVINAGN